MGRIIAHSQDLEGTSYLEVEASPHSMPSVSPASKDSLDIWGCWTCRRSCWRRLDRRNDPWRRWWVQHRQRARRRQSRWIHRRLRLHGLRGFQQASVVVVVVLVVVVVVVVFMAYESQASNLQDSLLNATRR